MIGKLPTSLFILLLSGQVVAQVKTLSSSSQIKASAAIAVEPTQSFGLSRSSSFNQKSPQLVAPKVVAPVKVIEVKPVEVKKEAVVVAPVKVMAAPVKIIEVKKEPAIVVAPVKIIAAPVKAPVIVVPEVIKKIEQPVACGLKISGFSQSNGELTFDTESATQGLDPYIIRLTQAGSPAGYWDSVTAKNKQLIVKGTFAVGLAKVRIQSQKTPTCFAEQDVTIAPVLKAIEGAKSRCDLAITGFTQVSDTLFFEVHSTEVSNKLYKVDLKQGSKSMGSWDFASYTSGQSIKASGVTASGEATVTIKDSLGCSAERVIKISPVVVASKVKCEEGPEILDISEVTPVGLQAEFKASGVIGVDYMILDKTQKTVASGSFSASSGTQSLSFKSLSAGNYKLTFKGNTCIGESSKNFSIESSIPVAEARQMSCNTSQKLSSITGITTKGLSANFDSITEKEFSYSVINAQGATVASGVTTPKDNKAVVSFSSLKAGSYTFSISDSMCGFTASKTFSITSRMVVDPNQGSKTAADLTSARQGSKTERTINVNNGSTTISTRIYAVSERPGRGGDNDEFEMLPCAVNPKITTLENVSNLGLTFNFDGSFSRGVAYKVVDSAKKVITSGEVPGRPRTGTLTFSPLLKGGSYNLVVSAIECIGEDQRTFSIEKGPIILDSEVSGNYVPKSIARGHPLHMDIEISGESGSWVINDMATLIPPKGYEFIYQINGQIVRRNSALKNFAWPSNNEVGIFKAQGKIGLETFNKWECGAPDVPYYDCQAGVTFEFNTSFAFSNFAFVPVGGKYDPENQRVQWMDVVSDYYPDPSQSFWMVMVGRINTPDELLKKGATHFRFDEFINDQKEWTKQRDAGRLYNGVHILRDQLNLTDKGSGKWVPEGSVWPNIWNTRWFDSVKDQPLTNEQGRQKGMLYMEHNTINVFENSEQDHAVGAHWPFWKEYYKALRGRLEERWGSKGIPYYLAHNYFTNFSGEGFSLGQTERSKAKQTLKIPVSQWPKTELLTGVLSDTNATSYGIYQSAPDLTRNATYDIIFASEVNRKANKKMMIFMQTVHEWRPNNLQEIRHADGVFYQYAKLPHNPSQAQAYGFLSRLFASGLVTFGSNVKNAGEFTISREWSSGLWYPKGATTPQSPDSYPHWTVFGNPDISVSNGVEDQLAFGIELYGKTFAKTRGGARKFLKFRLNKGAWTTPVNVEMDDLVDAYHDQKGIVFSEVKDGKLAIMYVNPYGENTRNMLEVEHEGKTYAMTVSSNKLYAKLIDLKAAQE